MRHTPSLILIAMGVAGCAIVVRDSVDEDTHIALVVHEYLHAIRGAVVHDLLQQVTGLPTWAVQGENGAAGDLPDRPHRDAELWNEIEADALRRWRAEFPRRE